MFYVVGLVWPPGKTMLDDVLRCFTRLDGALLVLVQYKVFKLIVFITIAMCRGCKAHIFTATVIRSPFAGTNANLERQNAAWSWVMVTHNRAFA